MSLEHTFYLSFPSVLGQVFRVWVHWQTSLWTCGRSCWLSTWLPPSCWLSRFSRLWLRKVEQSFLSCSTCSVYWTRLSEVSLHRAAEVTKQIKFVIFVERNFLDLDHLSKSKRQKHCIKADSAVKLRLERKGVGDTLNLFINLIIVAACQCS